MERDELSKLVDKYLRDNPMTIQQLCKKIGITNPTFQKILTGKGQIQTNKYYKMLNFLDRNNKGSE